MIENGEEEDWEQDPDVDYLDEVDGNALQSLTASVLLWIFTRHLDDITRPHRRPSIFVYHESNDFCLYQE